MLGVQIVQFRRRKRVSFAFERSDLTIVTDSVTSYGNILRVYLGSIGQNFETALVNFVSHWAHFHCCK